MNCYCRRRHSPMIGVTDSDNFLTSVSIGLGSKFWNLCAFDDTLRAMHVSLQGWEPDRLQAPLKLVGIDPLLSPSLASSVGSLRSVYEAWRTDNLSMSIAG